MTYGGAAVVLFTDSVEELFEYKRPVRQFMSLILRTTKTQPRISGQQLLLQHQFDW